MKTIDARTIALIGFAASQWAEERINGSRHSRRYRQLIAAGLALHQNGELYASAPKMRRALATIARHAAPLAMLLIACLLTACATTPQPETWNTERAKPVITIDIASIPPGALIYANAEYVGTAPLKMKVVADRFGNWEQNTRIQAYVPHDVKNYEEAVYPSGFRIPSRLLLRVPGYTHWHSATQQRPPQPLTIQ
jgi:hypothetical protein